MRSVRFSFSSLARAIGTSLVVVTALSSLPDIAQSETPTETGHRAVLDEYFRRETKKLADASLAEVRTLAQWEARRGKYRRQLFEMLGLDPLPEKTDLRAEVTGRVDRDKILVENVHFQSRPGLYVTGNLYLPKDRSGPAPTILYVCGHGPSRKDGVSYGNKVSYQHHGTWFARNGYVCLTIDTLQLGEIEGIHHGTYREKMWWWNSRGYSSAGVEAWNCIRALDYLETRPEVDRQRIGVTGRSGGGAYSWWIAALDDRIQAAVPAAGITDLTNHVVDGCVEGHCDCMYIVNTYRWDYPQVAALVAPRPLLLTNSDNDSIFPLDGVMRTHAALRRIYELYDATDRLGLQISPGPHQDTQHLQVAAFRWFNRFLKDDADSLAEDTGEKPFEPEELKVFASLPPDEKNTKIQDSFTAVAPPPDPPMTSEEWKRLKDGWMEAMKTKVFAGWPDSPDGLDLNEVGANEHDGIQFSTLEFTSQKPVRLRLFASHRADLQKAEQVVLHVMGPSDWERFVTGASQEFSIPGANAEASRDEKAIHGISNHLKTPGRVTVWFCPRGIGPSDWKADERKYTQIRRRFMLLGQTLDGMRVWDTRRAIDAIRKRYGAPNVRIALRAQEDMAGIGLYASLFEEACNQLDLTLLPVSHHQGPTFLNVLRFMDIPQAVAMAAENLEVTLHGDYDPEDWDFATTTAENLGWDGRSVVIQQLRHR